MLSAVARKDDVDRRRRQAQTKAKAEGLYRGRPESVTRSTCRKVTDGYCPIPVAPRYQLIGY
jgi:hypothetical protein